MRPRMITVVALSLFAVPSFARQVSSQVSQQSPQSQLPPLTPAVPQGSVHDPQAVAILEASMRAMGGAMPTDSVASGTIQIVAGSRTEDGTIRIATRGFNQTAEQIDTDFTHRTTVYSRGSASMVVAGTPKALPGETAVTAENHFSPLNLIAAALADPKTNCSYVGLESLNSAQAHHVRIWISIAQPAFSHLSNFSAKDLWIDTTTLLPIKLAFQRRWARTTDGFISIEILYSDYQRTSGALYPFHIDTTFNGTPRDTVIITSVAFNSGLTDAQFPLTQLTNATKFQGARQ